MANLWKLSYIMNFAPGTVRGSSSPGRFGGVSENYWLANQPGLTQIQDAAVARAGMLASDMTIAGFKLTPYTSQGNKLTPKASIAGFLNFGGSFSGFTNTPDDCLKLDAYANAVPVKWPIYIHAVPDAIVSSDQYVPTGAAGGSWAAALSLWLSQLTTPGTKLGGVIQWVGRDPTQVAQRVVNVNGPGGTIKTAAACAGVVATSFLRLRRVYDDNGNPIKGTFYVTAVAIAGDGSATYTVTGMPNQSRTTPSGTARNDLIANSPATSLTAKVISERKAGRPSLLFRGRRTKSRI